MHPPEGYVRKGKTITEVHRMQSLLLWQQVNMNNIATKGLQVTKILHAQLFHIYYYFIYFVQDLNSVLYPSLPVLEINKAVCSWILEQELLLVLPQQSHTHHVMTFRAFSRP